MPEQRTETPLPDPAAEREVSSSERSRLALSTRVRRALPWLLLGLVPTSCWMAVRGNFRFSLLIGLAGSLVACVAAFKWGQADAAVAAEDEERSASVDLSARAVVVPFVIWIASAAALFGALTLAVSGVLPAHRATAGALVTSTFLACVVATFRLGQRLSLWDERPLQRRYGFWLLALQALLFLPTLGSFSLIDPWETHYGEVAREMLARDDWISLWWAQDGWFWSKPILDFWMQGLSFSALGVQFAPGEMLQGIEQGRTPSPEWAARFPVFLLAALGSYVLYKGVARSFGARAAFAGGLVLSTTPYWFFLARQTMTDMPYVAPLCAAMGFLMLAFATPPEARLRVVSFNLGGKGWRANGLALVWIALGLLVLPQVFYLVSRHLTIDLAEGVAVHLDRFAAGSGGGSCGQPGNAACRSHSPLNTSFQPGHAALIWLAVMAGFVWLTRNERRAQRVFFMAAWLCMALSAMAKGAPGLVLPLFVTAAFILARRRYSDFLRLEPAAMALLFAAIVLPWYVQMVMRHGQPFLDRLLFHDMYKRAFVHVHDTNKGDDVSFGYYIWQLGYGLFPWSGLAAAGLLWAHRRDTEPPLPDRERTELAARDGGWFLMLWVLGGFAMFTISLTKFHHYIFPIVPPIAMLTGVFLAEGVQRAQLGLRRLLALAAGTLAASLALVYGGTRLLGGKLLGAVPASAGADDAARGLDSIGLGVMVAGALLMGLCWLAARQRTVAALEAALSQTEPAARERDPSSDLASSESERHLAALDSADEQSLDAHDAEPARAAAGDERHVAFATFALLAALALALIGRDLFTSEPGNAAGQVRLLQLFTYQYKRPWPTELDFEATLAAFTFAGAVLTAVFVVRRLRFQVLFSLGALAVVWCAWTVNVYFVKAAPHWGQRETIAAYYETRRGPEEQLVAYQMNWKGENFYTGNRMPTFVSSGKPFKEWIGEQRDKGTRVMFFTTEHHRVSTLKNELGKVKSLTEVTDKTLNNKFVLVRVEF